MREYVITSLENHLFFCRIMKEHALFLAASFPSGESNYIKKADWYRDQFENVLKSVVQIADGKVRAEVLCSGEVFTEYTETAEQQTQNLTGIPIDIQITWIQKRLRAGLWESPNREVLLQVRDLNQKVLQLLNGLIALKESIIRDVTMGNLFTTNYPLLIEHILREAKWYRQVIMNIENRRTAGNNRCRANCMISGSHEFNISFRNGEVFWNQIMMEHAQFIRGLLNPTECQLIEAADGFVKKYCDLLEEARQQDCRVDDTMRQRALIITEKYRDFKAAGTKGVSECRIRSVILPLLTDHVLREANHYLRLLKG